jgi:Chlorophyll A-B binding protein
MKLSATIIFSSLAATSAFTTSSMKPYTSLQMAVEVAESDISEAAVVQAEPPVPVMSQSMPFMARPAALDGSLAGDVGFDPLGFAKTSDDLMKFREAEVKHARLAMLAAAGWPISELFDKKIASLFGLAPLLVGDDRAPSVLNGGLGKVSPIYWIACVAGAAAIDLYGITKASKKQGYTPGDLGFDPLGVFPKEKEGQEWFRLAEIKNGRLAMIAITAFAIQELVSQTGVINETPLFFKPIGETLHQYANSGYIH